MIVQAASQAIEQDYSCDEIPLFFAPASEALYGVFHRARVGRNSRRVLVFCHSVGIEHMVAQRMCVLGARAAANAGLAAFRYDARAHGDSTGDARNVTLAELVDDACAAADHARKLSGASQIIWIGVRFGCLIAARAIARRSDTAAFAMWEPLHHAGEYFRSVTRTTKFCQIAQGKYPRGNANDLLTRLEVEGVVPVVGTYLYRQFSRSAQDADLESALKSWAGDTLIAQVQLRRTLSPNNQQLCSDIQQRGGKVTTTVINQEPSWNMLPLVRPQWTNDALLPATMEWLHGMD
jgi:pimeloyl-ACP methyl ester carboxylesterase